MEPLVATTETLGHAPPFVWNTGYFCLFSFKGRTKGVHKLDLSGTLAPTMIEEVTTMINKCQINTLVVCWDGDVFREGSFTTMIPGVCAALWQTFRIKMVIVYGTSDMSPHGASTPNWDELMQAVIKADVPVDMCTVNSIVAHVGRESLADLALAHHMHSVAARMSTLPEMCDAMKMGFIENKQDKFQGCGTTSNKFDCSQFGYLVLGMALLDLMKPRIVLYVQPGAVTTMELLAIQEMRIGVRTHDLDCVV